LKSWLPGVEKERKRTSERKTAKKQANVVREGRKRAKETELQKKRTTKGGTGRETERRERARVRALKTTQRAHATTMNEWMSE